MFLLNEVIAFFSFEPLINAIKVGGYHSLLSVSGFIYATAPVIPLLLSLELLFTVATRKSSIAKYKVTFAIYVINLLVGKIIVLDVAAFVIAHLEKYAPIHTSLTWYWFAYAYVVWELGQFIYHYASHKVRLLWCAHAPHHAVEHMNLSVSYAAFFLQGPVAYAIRTSVCMLLGVTPVMMALVMVVDTLWGGLVHISEEVWPSGRLDRLKSVIFSPAHHRIHHARNVEYIDKNFCVFLNIWDRIFGTYQDPVDGVSPDYGITRGIDADSVVDVYFCEFVYLWRDIRGAPNLWAAFLYVVMPPGWVYAKSEAQSRTA